MFLNEALEWTGTKGRIVAIVGNVGFSCIAQRNLQLLRRKTFVEVGDL